MCKSNTKFLICLSLTLILLTSLPYLYGYLTKPAGTVFLGTGFFNPGDLPVYYSYIEQAKNGHWLFKDLFTSEAGQLPFINLLWLVIGWLARLLSISPLWAFHLARLILVPVFVWVVYKFCRLISHYVILRPKAEESSIENNRRSFTALRMTLLLFFFSGGFGGLVSFFQKNPWQPLEIWWPEAYAFWSIYHSPHFIASWILIAASFYFLLKGYLSGRWREIVWAGLLAALASQFHSFYLALFAPISLMFAFYQLFSRKNPGGKIFWQTTVYNLFLLPVAFYYYLYLASDRVMWGRLFENFMPTPYAALVLTAFGFISILAGLTIFRYFQSSGRGQPQRVAPTLIWNFLIIWVIGVLFLLYSPLPFQRRLIEGWQLPVVILAVPSLVWLLNFLKIKKMRLERYFLYLLFGLLFIASNINIWFNTFTIYRQTSRQPNFYLSENLWQALAWLNRRGNLNEIVLTAKLTGMMTPFLAEKTVFWGHDLETINSKNKAKTLAWFFSNNREDEQKKEFLKQTGIKYVVWGEWEKKLGDFQPEKKNYLKKIYENQETRIYQIKQ